MKSYIQTTNNIRAIYDSKGRYYAIHMSNCCIGHVNKQTGFIARTYFAANPDELYTIARLTDECTNELKTGK